MLTLRQLPDVQAVEITAAGQPLLVPGVPSPQPRDAWADVDPNGRIIPHKVSRQDMAKVVGASREMVSRVMKDLEGRGAIQTLPDGRVVLKDSLLQV